MILHNPIHIYGRDGCGSGALLEAGESHKASMAFRTFPSSSSIHSYLAFYSIDISIPKRIPCYSAHCFSTGIRISYSFEPTQSLTVYRLYKLAHNHIR